MLFTSIRPLPPSFIRMYSLSTSALGCNISCMFNSLRVFVSIFFSSEIFLSMMPKLYCTTGTARLLTASILFLPVSSVLSQSYSPIIFFSRLFHFVMLDTITFIYTQVFVYSFLVQLSYFCVISYYYISSWGQFTFLKTGFVTFLKSENFTVIITELFHLFQFSKLFLLYNFRSSVWNRLLIGAFVVTILLP